MLLSRTLSLSLLFAICASGCSISEKKLSEFGSASDQTVALVATPSRVTEQLIVENTIAKNNCRYLNGSSYILGAPPHHQTSQLLKDQKAVSNALAAYSKAIAGALDSAEQTKLEEAGASFSTAATDVATTAELPANTGPIVGAIVRAILAIEKNRRQEAVKQEMKTVLPFLQRLRQLVDQDQQRAIAEMDAQIANWERQQKCVLNASRGKANASELFLAADTRKRELLGERKKAAQAVNALDALIDAHFAIVFGDDGDFDEGIDILNKFLADFVAIKNA